LAVRYRGRSCPVRGRLAWHDCGDRHRRTNAVFQHQGPFEGVCDTTGHRVFGDVYSQGHYLPGAPERHHRILHRGWNRIDHCRCDGGVRITGRHDAHDERGFVAADRRHVRFVFDFRHCAGDAHRSGRGLCAMTEAVMEAVNVVKTLGRGPSQVQALRDVSLSLAGGELTLLMGPSGSGKTTLLSVLGCMLSPTGGSVQIRGRSTTGLDAEQLAELRRDNVGFVFQSYHLFPTLTAAENVRLALDVRGDCSLTARIKADKALATVGLSHKSKSFPRELSGGEQQRVAIARAIVGDASVILADEPTAALDSETGQAVMTVL